MKIVPIEIYRIRIIWQNLAEENIEQLDRVQASFPWEALELYITTQIGLRVS